MCMCVCVRACVRVCMRACVHVCMRTCVHAYVCACMRVDCWPGNLVLRFLCNASNTNFLSLLQKMTVINNLFLLEWIN